MKGGRTYAISTRLAKGKLETNEGAEWNGTRGLKRMKQNESTEQLSREEKSRRGESEAKARGEAEQSRIEASEA